MGKIYNITDKLSFEEHPVIMIHDTRIEVNDDAVTMLKIMEIVGDGDTDPNPADIVKMADLLFTKEGKKNLDNLRLNMQDYTMVIEAAITLITGEELEQGEAENDTTTS